MCPKGQLWAVALGITLLNGGLLACGRPDLRSDADTGTPTASGARTSPQASPSSSPTGDETAVWMSYTSSAYGYTVKYPPGWYMPTSSADNQNFSSENVGSPIALSPTGLWFYVLITNASQA